MVDVIPYITEGEGIDASVDGGLFEVNVLEHVWDPVLCRRYQVFGGLG